MNSASTSDTTLVIHDLQYNDWNDQLPSIFKVDSNVVMSDSTSMHLVRCFIVRIYSKFHVFG